MSNLCPRELPLSEFWKYMEQGWHSVVREKNFNYLESILSLWSFLAQYMDSVWSDHVNLPLSTAWADSFCMWSIAAVFWGVMIDGVGLGERKELVSFSTPQLIISGKEEQAKVQGQSWSLWITCSLPPTTVFYSSHQHWSLGCANRKKELSSPSILSQTSCRKEQHSEME